MVITDKIKSNPAYSCWLNYKSYGKMLNVSLKKYCGVILKSRDSMIADTAVNELKNALTSALGKEPDIVHENSELPCIELLTESSYNKNMKTGCGFSIKYENVLDRIVIKGSNDNGLLYGVFNFIFALGSGKSLKEIETEEKTLNNIRIMEQWDNFSGQIERGYSGNSIFYSEGKFTQNYERIRDYARLLSSVRVNYISINNVNVHAEETKFITDKYLPYIKKIADIFSLFGIKVLLSINFAAPMILGGLDTADPLDENVKKYWKETAEKIYSYIPNFGGFLVKADSESRPGPYTYGRNHAEGANMLAEALETHGGIVVWRCFVYNCNTDWRNRKLDRAKAAYDNFMPLDGDFKDNVLLQIKNGPMDFQIREPVTPLFGGLEKTNQVIEFQIAQEYTGHQIDLCYLVPLWKEALDFDTFAKGKNSKVSDIVSGKLFNTKNGGIAGVSNIGDSPAWTGNPLAAANLFGFGMMAWSPEYTSEEIAELWVKLTFGGDKTVVQKITDMLMRSREIYENYTCPLGIGWFVNPDCHYGPSVDGYEYSRWGTYHYADVKGIGVDRTVISGTGYAGQYRKENAEMYENIETCPENLLLFFHHIPYDYRLKSGMTLLQHIYDTHFKGADEVKNLQNAWQSLKGKIEPSVFDETAKRFEMQLKDAFEWRDVVNTYFYRRTGIKDGKGRHIYE